MSTKKKLEIVPAEPGATTAPNPFVTALVATDKKFDNEKIVKLTLPTLIKPDHIPVGGVVGGEIVRVIINFTGSKEDSMRSSRVIYLRHASGTEFLFPVSGVIRNSLRDYLAEPDTKDATERATGFLKDNQIVGWKLWVKRNEDSVDKKFKKRMFMFDVVLEKP